MISFLENLFLITYFAKGNLYFMTRHFPNVLRPHSATSWLDLLIVSEEERSAGTKEPIIEWNFEPSFAGNNAGEVDKNI